MSSSARTRTKPKAKPLTFTQSNSSAAPLCLRTFYTLILELSAPARAAAILSWTTGEGSARAPENNSGGGSRHSKLQHTHREHRAARRGEAGQRSPHSNRGTSSASSPLPSLRADLTDSQLRDTNVLEFMSHSPDLNNHTQSTRTRTVRSIEHRVIEHRVITH